MSETENISSQIKITPKPEFSGGHHVSPEDTYTEKMNLVKASTKDLFDIAVSKLHQVAVNHDEAIFFMQEYGKYRDSRDKAESNGQEFSGIIYDEYEAVDNLRDAKIKEIKKYPELLLNNSDVPEF